jgi:hypothetical protein
MTLQSVVSIVTVALIVARAVNILKIARRRSASSQAQPGRPIHLKPALAAVTAAVMADGTREPRPASGATSRFRWSERPSRAHDHLISHPRTDPDSMAKPAPIPLSITRPTRHATHTVVAVSLPEARIPTQSGSTQGREPEKVCVVHDARSGASA